MEGLALQNVRRAPFTDAANIFRLLLKNLVRTILETRYLEETREKGTVLRAFLKDFSFCDYFLKQPKDRVGRVCLVETLKD